MFIKNQAIILHRDVPSMQKHLSSSPWTRYKPVEEPLVFTDYAEHRKYINNIDLYSFLGIPAYQKFHCPFCNKKEGYISHYDEEDVWTYRCFAEKRTHNIIGMTQQIAGCSYSQAIEYINQVYNLSIKVDSPLTRAIDHNIRVLSDSSFKESYPLMTKFLGTYHSSAIALYTALKSLHNESFRTKSDEEVVALTTQETRKILGVGQEKARTILRWMILLTMVDAVHRSELDSRSKARLEYISDHDRFECISLYRIKLLDDEQLDVCEAKAQELLPLRLTRRNMTLKTARAITSEFAEDYTVISPNLSHWKRTMANGAAEEAMQIYSDLLMQGIAEHGYVREKDLPLLIRLTRERDGTSFTIPVTWREVRSAVIRDCGCSAVPADRDQLKLLGVTDIIHGTLLVPTEQVYSCEGGIGEVLNNIALHGCAMAAQYLPITQAHRKQFREMLEQCGVTSVRLNDALREKYDLLDAALYAEIFIDENDN